LGKWSPSLENEFSPSQVELGKEAFFKVLLSNYFNIGKPSEFLLCLLIDVIIEVKLNFYENTFPKCNFGKRICNF